MGDENLSMLQLFEFMKSAEQRREDVEKRREAEHAAVQEKLGAIQLSQVEFAGTWKPKVDRAIDDLSGAINYLKERVENIDRQIATAVAGTGLGAAASQAVAAVARSGRGVVNLQQQQPPLLTLQAPPPINRGFGSRPRCAPSTTG